MAVEEIKNFDSNEGIKKENVSTNKVDYNNPSKKIMEENDKEVKKEQEEADDLLPENIEKKRFELAKRVNSMEESPTKDSYMNLLGMIKAEMKKPDCNWGELPGMLNRIEEKINNWEKINEIKTKEMQIEEEEKIKSGYKNINEIRKSMKYTYTEWDLFNKMEYEDTLLKMINETQNTEDKKLLQKELERSFIEPLISNNFLEKTWEIKWLYNDRKKYEIKNNWDKIEVSTRLKENEKPLQPTIFTKEELLK